MTKVAGDNMTRLPDPEATCQTAEHSNNGGSVDLSTSKRRVSN